MLMVASDRLSASTLPRRLRLLLNAKPELVTVFAVFTIGVLLWLVYGLYIDSLPIVIANGITLMLASAMVVFIWRFGRRKVKHGRAGH